MPPKLASGVSKSCRCGAPGERHCRGVCGPCRRVHAKVTNPDYWERHLERNRRYKADNRGAVSAYDRAYRMKNVDRVYFRNIKRKYGVSPQMYRALYEMQRGECAICRVSQDAIGRRLVLDHCHRTNEPRGLLCSGCNVGLGQAEKAGAPTYSWYLQWTPVMRLRHLSTLTDDERAAWNWS